MSDEPEQQYEEPSAEQKLNIATYFVMSAPVGEVHDVLKDVIALVNDPEVLNEERIIELMRTYNTNNLVAAQTPDGTASLVSPFGEVSNDMYLDASSGKVLKFDHRKQQFVGETDQRQVLPDRIDATRRAIQNSVRQYLESSYNDGRWALAVYGTDDAQITVCISAKNVRLASYWSGGIQCKYAVNVGAPGQTELTGNIRIQTHYFEDGNVQLNINLDKTGRANVSEPEATGKSVAAVIQKIESDFHSSLEEMYLNMNSDVFKAMRRMLPVTREPMTWTSAAHSVANTLGKQ